MTKSATAPLLVLGLGNPLLRDDGVGLRVLAEVERAVAEAASIALSCIEELSAIPTADGV